MKQKLAPVLRQLSQGQLGIPLLLMTILGMVMLPVPPVLLDMLFTFNIVLALLVMLVSVYSKRSLDFSVFPSILLIATLLRLALNVASTRVVLLHGHQGGDAAGKVIQAFGDVVIGGNYVVGMVVFVILMIINFVVVTKGGERISEVSARFTLDAMPGKQMAIDADLNAGIIDHNQAKKRREDVAQEADFYGSMDGASKFVRGDAIAGMLILFINIIGGISIGVFQHGLSFSDAFQTFALLTIGDGLVAQIPSLLLATSAAIVVTRVTDSNDLANQISKQMLASPRALFVVAGLMLILGLIPGMPHMAFLCFAAVVGFAGWKMREAPAEIDDEDLARAEEIVEQHDQSEQRELAVQDIPMVHAISLNVGYRLVSLIDRKQGAELLNRLLGIRKTLTEHRGFVVPQIHVRDDLALEANHYKIAIRGATICEAEVEMDCLLAINPGQVYGSVDGIMTRDPAYNMEAVWIKPHDKDKAVNLGYTVVDHATIISTHISKVINDCIEEVLSPEEVTSVMDRLAGLNSKLADDLQQKLSQQQLLRVFRQLTVDGVSLSDIVTIANSLVESAELSKDPILLAADVRCMLRRVILGNLVGTQADIPAITLSAELENMLVNALSQAQAGGHVQLDGFALEPTVIEQLQRSLPEVLDNMRLNNCTPILLVMPQLRPLLARYARICARGLHVLSFNEIPDDRNVSVVGNMG
ncbi:flagellar biosynthesis protein FlhA [Photobacterium jeanii]|uniref:Flagellar biosynthesis protein FlhA n=1 Tax=Photobacterium jeanii TaxID=858640 RepID=A0A178KI77_9GAMM|nr:flagellar biosynthesis protein FlhA [Photobacterium jeanii]OAN16695.1 flagellar biosynthesis protein FlhA [Photobacterium jeanii]PST87424.1 flagellar biosynthesis protein FlhA [Photobacterium jeanii]